MPSRTIRARLDQLERIPASSQLPAGRIVIVDTWPEMPPADYEQVMGNLGTIVPKLPANEAQAHDRANGDLVIEAVRPPDTAVYIR